MEIVELIRNASSAPQVLAALSAYAQTLRDIAVLPEGFVQPLQGEADVHERIAMLFAVVNLTSQHRLHEQCDAAKRALRVFATALQRLRRASPRA